MNELSGYSGNKTIETRIVNGVSVDIVGCFEKDTPVRDFEYYDLFADGECINLGEPCYTYPNDDCIEAFLELQEILRSD